MMVLPAFCFWAVLCMPNNANPNVIVFLADDLGWADLGCYCSSYHETPNLDQLAKQGMRFTTAYSAASLCSPTRASIMTGKTSGAELTSPIGFPARRSRTQIKDAARSTQFAT